ncbi:MAG TPA: WecB/TagA/CpsF family glycosyltransferase [Micromonosporaceae bacterium]
MDHVRAALERGQGGRILTPNIDVLRQIGSNDEARAALDDSTIVVADGMPVVWASRIAGTPLPQRVSGADLIWSLARGLGHDGRTVFVVGGEPAAAPANTTHAWTAPEPARTGRHAANAYRDAPPNDRRNAGPAHRAAGGRPARNESVPFQRRRSDDGAHVAAAALVRSSPGLTVVGAISPAYGFDRDPSVVELIQKEIVAARPDLVLVGVGFPRQERLISAMRCDLPRSWFLGCGMAINFVAGEKPRAPEWMQRTGVEWLHRLAGEPGRLGERYLRHDLPFAAGLLARSALNRVRGNGSPPGRHAR